MATQDSQPKVVAHPIQSQWLYGRSLKWTLARASSLLLGAFVIFHFWLIPIRVTGISMMPTYKNGQINFINKRAFQKESPRRFDVVALKPEGYDEIYLKRIIGLPGEEIFIFRGQVFVNGVPLVEPHALKSPYWFYPPHRLEGEEYLLIGDNRSMRQQNHFSGIFPSKFFLGKILY